MTLRTRLVLWLLLMSVVPLGAVTVYSYVNSADALRVAAAREADLLANELSSRMQLVTTELSARVEKLMSIQEQAATPTVQRAATAKRPAVKPKSGNATAASGEPAANAPSRTASTGATPNAASSVPGTADPAALASATSAGLQSAGESEVARALGDAALLLNRVELQGMRGYFPRGGRQSGESGRGGSRAESPVSGVSGSAGPVRSGSAEDEARGRGNHRTVPNADSRQFGPRGRQPQTPAESTTAPSPAAPASPSAPAPGGAMPSVPPMPNVPSAPASVAIAPTAPVAPDRFVIDVGAIVKDMTKRLAPQGLDKMTPEEQQRVRREIGLRMMGITEGLRLSADELKKRADQAREKAAEDVKAAEASGAHQDEAAPAAKTETKATLTGNKLGVTVERAGKVVHAANAEVNLDNLLMTVFSTTRHEQGEVPFAIAKDGKLYTQTAADKATVQSFGDVIKPSAKTGATTVRDWIVVTNADPQSGFRFGIARPVGDSLAALRKTAGRNAGLGLLFIGLALVIVVPVSQGLTRNLSTLTDAAGKLSAGDFSARVPVKGSREMSALASAFNRMAADIQQQQEQLVGQERLKRELELGRQIQSEMLPHESLRFGLTEVKGMSIPAREVGGDFFNYFALENGDVALLVGDVSGKGVGAALLMANFQATLRTRLTLGHDLAAIADAIDRDMAATSPRGLYTTLFVGILNPTTRHLRYVNAGHNPQFALRAARDGADRADRIVRLSSTGTPIGLLPGRGYTQAEVQLAPGDVLFFYTDGVVEAENERGDMFGSDRLEQLLLSTIGVQTGDPDSVLQHVEASVREFRGSREPFDDATSMVVRIG